MSSGLFEWLAELLDRLLWRLDPDRDGTRHRDPHYLRSRVRRIAWSYWWRIRNAWDRMLGRL
ncbi:hypothetical protein ACFFGH_10600 [Lysobacter korlensis]|uniref:Transposase n=1 Tax=Lysobacter korlensis TaxID=553636 RepID=A0ABV6RMS7_9GAMM